MNKQIKSVPSNRAMDYMKSDPSEDKARKTLQALWDSVEEGIDGQRLKELSIDLLYDEVKLAFDKQFLPLQHLRKHKTEEWTRFDNMEVSVRFDHADLFQATSPAEVLLEEKYNDVFAGFLVQAERVVREKRVEGAISSTTPNGAVSPDDMWAVLRELSGRPSAMHAGSMVMHTMLRHPEWKGIFKLTPESKTIQGGLFGKAFGMDCYTDVFRYDTMRVLEKDEWTIFPVNSPTRVDWVWQEPVHVADNTTLIGLLLIGEVKPEDYKEEQPDE